MKPWRMVLLSALILVFLPATASADSGPKPSVVVDFNGLEGQTYYATLLSRSDSTGPWSKHETLESAGLSYGSPAPELEAVWTAFHNYQDPDGFYFLGCFENCSETHRFAWRYYPPQQFKLLLYFPQSGIFAAGQEVHERYAFDSYFSVNGEGAQESQVLPPLEKTYDFGWEVLSFLARLVLTLAAELALALLFGYRSRPQLRVILCTNLVTQVLLNVLLNLINFRYGAWMFLLNYFWMEGVVFLLEGMVYHKTLSVPQEKTHPWRYAFSANAASLMLGLLIAKVLPGIF